MEMLPDSFEWQVGQMFETNYKGWKRRAKLRREEAQLLELSYPLEKNVSDQPNLSRLVGHG